MNNKKFRVISLILVCLMLITGCLTGCGKNDAKSGEDNLNPLGSEPISKEKVERLFKYGMSFLGL